MQRMRRRRELKTRSRTSPATFAVSLRHFFWFINYFFKYLSFHLFIYLPVPIYFYKLPIFHGAIFKMYYSLLFTFYIPTNIIIIAQISGRFKLAGFGFVFLGLALALAFKLEVYFGLIVSSFVFCLLHLAFRLSLVFELNGNRVVDLGRRRFGRWMRESNRPVAACGEKNSPCEPHWHLGLLSGSR